MSSLQGKNALNVKKGMVIKMTVTDVKIRKTFEEGPLRAIASVTFDAQLAVHDIKVISAGERLFLVMPGKKKPDGTYRDMAHPINADFRSMLENAVIGEYLRVAEEDKQTPSMR